jgi:hypothetical protein
MKMEFDITSVALTFDGSFACVSTQDTPLYSIFIIRVGVDNQDFKIIEQRSLLSIMEYESF